MWQCGRAGEGGEGGPLPRHRRADPDEAAGPRRGHAARQGDALSCSCMTPLFHDVPLLVSPCRNGTSALSASHALYGLWWCGVWTDGMRRRSSAYACSSSAAGRTGPRRHRWPRSCSPSRGHFEDPPSRRYMICAQIQNPRRSLSCCVHDTHPYAPLSPATTSSPHGTPARLCLLPQVRKSVLLSVACGAMTLGSDCLLVPTQVRICMDIRAWQ